MLIDFFFDFETRSEANLKKVGVVKYATDPTTEVTLITWCFGKDGEIKAWRRGQPIPLDLIEVATNPHKFNFVAHNILFDYMIWIIPFARLIPLLVRPDIKNITDNMAMTQNFRVGSSLDGSAAMLRLPYSKDKEGRRLMLKQCKPQTVGKNAGKFYELTETEWFSFERYGIMDTKLLREIYYRCPPLPPHERWGFEWTFKRNLRGIKVDTKLLDIMIQILNIEIPKLSKEFEVIVNHKFKVNQIKKGLEYFSQYYPMQNMQKDTVRDALASGNHPCPYAKRALEIKAIVGSTSLAKVDTARRRMHNGRLYELLNFLKAHTKRWAGMGVQIQNFPRSANIDGLENLNVTDLAEKVAAIYNANPDADNCGLVKNLLRRLWIPDEGKTFYCGDFSKIEPTILFWFAGLGNVPKNVYEETASAIYNVPAEQIGKDSEERQVGKATFLGGGYGMGNVRFKTQIAVQAGINISTELARQSINGYRKKYWKIPQFWRYLESAFRGALAGQQMSLANGALHFMPMLGKSKQGVIIRLPSGGELYYPDAGAGEDGLSYGAVKGTTLVREGIYGGLLCEHVVSATARDLMLSSMIKLENAGFDILNTVHDEVWAQADSGFDKAFEQTMCTLPNWAGDLSVTVEGENGVRYLK